MLRREDSEQDAHAQEEAVQDGLRNVRAPHGGSFLDQGIPLVRALSPVYDDLEADAETVPVRSDASQYEQPAAGDSERRDASHDESAHSPRAASNALRVHDDGEYGNAESDVRGVDDVERQEANGSSTERSYDGLGASTDALTAPHVRDVDLRPTHDFGAPGRDSSPLSGHHASEHGDARATNFLEFDGKREDGGGVELNAHGRASLLLESDAASSFRFRRRASLEGLAQAYLSPGPTRVHASGVPPRYPHHALASPASEHRTPHRATELSAPQLDDTDLVWTHPNHDYAAPDPLHHDEEDVHPPELLHSYADAPPLSVGLASPRGAGSSPAFPSAAVANSAGTVLVHPSASSDSPAEFDGSNGRPGAFVSQAGFRVARDAHPRGDMFDDAVLAVQQQHGAQTYAQAATPAHFLLHATEVVSTS
ncbi:MAG: hypothetical protein EOO81_04510 [Oxalobacteraceae bacterium]|nr:MAG: hypothetical protein EOO81_04510 [Oxalobacteraceae bacterium]